jgi:hypothetical protein
MAHLNFHRTMAGFAVLCASLAPAAVAQGANIDPAVIESIKSYLASDIVQLSVLDQNQRYRDRSTADIETLDQQWRRETQADAKPLISSTLTNPLSAYLTRIQAHSNGMFTEIFVMDDKGLNVGQSSISTDYWQGDEDKWQKTYAAGAGSIFIDQPEYNDGTRSWHVQVNLSVDDPATRKVIGAATFEINLNEMRRRRGGGAQ